MDHLRWELRAYELSLPREKRKRLGQFFTETAVARLLAAIAIRRPVQRVLDAMAGHGNLLDAAAERLALIGAKATFYGVEIDPDTARLCETRMRTTVDHCRQLGATIACGDAFSQAVWTALDAEEGYDLVIGNPPYVRYQATKGDRDEVRDGLRAIAERYAPEPERDVWRTLINGYSGLADLSVPSWILCSLLCKAGGILALVVPRTWTNRDYARIVRYLQLRFFEPQLIVEEHGVGWFEDALVPTTLVVSRRLAPESSLVPLHRRDYSDRTVVRVGVSPTAGSPESLIAKVFPGNDPEAAFASWATNSAATAIDHLARQHEALSEELSRVLAIIPAQGWARAAEGARSSTPHPSPDPRALVPSAIAQAIRLPELVNLMSLTEAGVQVGQGLRTGCNGFFYVEELPSDDPACATVRASDLFHHRQFHVPRTVLRPVLRRQAEIRGFAIESSLIQGRVLDLRNWFLPEERELTQGELFGASLSHEMPESLAAYVRQAAITSVGRNGQAMPIPTLSAVAPNERTGGRGEPRRWYMLPDFAPRHLPHIFTPRVNDGTPWFVGNITGPLLIDANFSTIHELGPAPTVAALLALLNSTWTRACCEAIGSPMGGGALKLEATHLRSLPMPRLSAGDWRKLDRLGQKLIVTDPAHAADIVRRVDVLTISAITGAGSTPDTVAVTCDTLAALLHSLRQQRQRKGALRA